MPFRENAVKRIAAILVLAFASAAFPAPGDEPLVGMWQMIFQEVGGAKTKPLPVALRVTQDGSMLIFSYLANRELELTRTFTAHMDGSPVPLKDGHGATLGVVRLTKVSPTEYRMVMQSPNGPPEPGKLIIAEKGFILRCESEAVIPDVGRRHIVQVFSRLAATPAGD
jgi:hypothetical protein